MTMKFYMTPGSCSTGVHILLEEAGLVFEAYIVNLMSGDQHQPEYLALNPKGTIPTLVLEDGTALTDFASIALWIAKTYPRRKLLPENLVDELKVLEVLNYAVNTIHGQGFTRIFTTDKYSSDPAEQEKIKAQGHEIVANSFALVNDWLSHKTFIAEKFSIADAALFYVEFWAKRIDIDLPENCLKHYQTMLKKMSVQQVLAEEGYASELQR
jgi:glutathione S-transferase